MTMKKLIIILGLWTLAPSSVWAGGTEGATPFNFLFMDANARPVALGGAYAAAVQDANALLYNPAGLGSLTNNHVTFQHTKYFQGATQEYGAIALRQGVGFMVNTLTFGNIQRTTLSNPKGIGLGSFGIRDLAISLGYGKSFKTGLFSFGIAGKYLREKIDTCTAQSQAVDIGALLDLTRIDVPLSLGVAVQNLGTRIKFQSVQEELPVNLRAGVAFWFLGSGLLVLDVNLPKKGDATLHVGGEYVALGILALRAGYNGRNETDRGFTAGGGFQLNQFSIDYAFVPFGDLGNSHRFSLSYRW